MQEISIKKQPSFLLQLILVYGVGLILGVTSIWLPPYFLLVGIAGIIYLVVAWSWPEFALLGILLFTSTIFDIYALPSIPIGIGNLIISDILIFVLIGIIFLRLVTRTTTFIHTAIDVPLMAFYGAAILATAIGIYDSRVTFNQSLGEVRVVNFYLAFFIVTNLIRSEKQVRRLLNGIFLLAFFVGVMMIAQYILGDQVKIMPGRVETLGTAGVKEAGVTRILPPGQSLVVVVFITQAILLIFDRKPSSYMVRFILTGVTGLAVLLTFFRNYWIAFALSMLFVGLLVSIRDKVKYAKVLFWSIFFGMLVLAPLLTIKGGNVGKLIEGVTVRMATIFDPDTAKESSLTYRYIENEYVIPEILAHPLFGLGLGANYRPRDPRLDFSKSLKDSLTWYIHNGHFWIIVKTGLIGYLFFMWLFILFIKRGLQHWKSIPNPFLRGIVLSFAVTILSLLFSVFVNPVFTNSWWAPVIGIMLGVNEVILRLYRDVPSDVKAVEKLT